MDEYEQSLKALGDFAKSIGKAERDRFADIFSRANIPTMKKFYSIIKDCESYDEAINKLQNQRNYR